MAQHGEDEEHPAQEKRQRHSADMRLRDAKFQIYRRPNKGEALWKRGPIWRDVPVFTQSEALAIVAAEQREGRGP